MYFRCLKYVYENQLIPYRYHSSTTNYSQFSICVPVSQWLSSRLHTCSIWCTQSLQIDQPKEWFQSSKTDLSGWRLSSGNAKECGWYQWHQDIWLWVLLVQLNAEWYGIYSPPRLPLTQNLITISNFALELEFFNLLFFSAVRKYNPWGGMTNNGMNENVTSQADAETYLKYLDGDSYTHIPGLIYRFDDGSNYPFRIRQDSNGNLRLSDDGANKHEILCQYDCQGMDIARNSICGKGWGQLLWGAFVAIVWSCENWLISTEMLKLIWTN